ncbi:hypothetical protein EVAR_5128_1 [Eumeta japonica]|uniref:Uncharacterized protein n=1 Tax=Eumeta variegata TaxID=151549 RepID=A0A4C1SUJ8_EUMVA|nr:hypothetical protein EVAR_5128_1 [Eumeta japonica]
MWNKWRGRDRENKCVIPKSWDGGGRTGAQRAPPAHVGVIARWIKLIFSNGLRHYFSKISYRRVVSRQGNSLRVNNTTQNFVCTFNVVAHFEHYHDTTAAPRVGSKETDANKPAGKNLLYNSEFTGKLKKNLRKNRNGIRISLENKIGIEPPPFSLSKVVRVRGARDERACRVTARAELWTKATPHTNLRQNTPGHRAPSFQSCLATAHKIYDVQVSTREFRDGALYNINLAYTFSILTMRSLGARQMARVSRPQSDIRKERR